MFKFFIKEILIAELLLQSNIPYKKKNQKLILLKCFIPLNKMLILA